MTIKNDLTDIGYLLITPYPKKYRFEGVNYKRATIQLAVGLVTLNALSLGMIIFGDAIADKIYDVKTKVNKKLKK